MQSLQSFLRPLASPQDRRFIAHSRTLNAHGPHAANNVRPLSAGETGGNPVLPSRASSFSAMQRANGTVPLLSTRSPYSSVQCMRSNTQPLRIDIGTPKLHELSLSTAGSVLSSPLLSPIHGPRSPTTPSHLDAHSQTRSPRISAALSMDLGLASPVGSLPSPRSYFFSTGSLDGVLELVFAIQPDANLITPASRTAVLGLGLTIETEAEIEDKEAKRNNGFIQEPERMTILDSTQPAPRIRSVRSDASSSRHTSHSTSTPSVKSSLTSNAASALARDDPDATKCSINSSHSRAAQHAPPHRSSPKHSSQKHRPRWTGELSTSAWRDERSSHALSIIRRKMER
ncbi:hypothetical protein BKA62DRAFT_682515 [Auriculariales sp. MPI-PUGE-AT-0066]|nr:hypothetical protein BKA62DRAFT_682515 [Auriculariales sp. MPI-PUGE-AT-0066]